MKVIKAQTAGFCFGVKRAVDQVYDLAAKEKEPVYTYGPIIHNEEVVRDLEEKGVQVLNGKEDLLSVKKGTVVIRSHGVAEEVYDLICENGLNLADATCPFVKKIHRIVRREGENGREIVIIGNANHPEVEGIRGWCVSKVTVIGTEEEAEEFERNIDSYHPIKIYIDGTVFLSQKIKNKLDTEGVEILPIPDYYFAKDIKGGN